MALFKIDSEKCDGCGACVDECEALQKNWEIGPEKVDALLRSRRSVRAFKARPSNRV